MRVCLFFWVCVIVHFTDKASILQLLSGALYPEESAECIVFFGDDGIFKEVLFVLYILNKII